MKAKFLILTLLLCSSLVFSQELDSTEIALYSEINTYINNGYYPGVIEKVETMEKDFPESVFIVPSRLYKGEALINLGRYEEAEEALNKVLPSMHFGNENLDKCWYLLGKTRFLMKKYIDAAKAFYNCCAVSKKAGQIKYYNPSVIYLGRINYIEEKYEDSLPLFEYVAANGKGYGKEDYVEGVQKLFVAYNLCGKYDKTTALFEQYKKEDFEESVYYFLQFYAAEAYEKTSRYLESYNLYCELIENPDKNLAVAALKNAYLISHEHRLNVNTSEIFDKINENQEGFSSMLSDFWTRLGIDAYNIKDYKKARECFEYAQTNKTTDTDLVMQIYEAKMKIDQGLSKDQAKKTAAVLQLEEEKVQVSKVKGLSDSYYAVLMRLRALCEDWAAVRNCFDKIEFPKDEDLYYGAAGYYKNGNYAEAEGFIKDCKLPQAKLLYANILGRQGRNAEAADIYVAINASQALDNVNRLEFAKVLYNQKKYDAAYKHAKTANQPLSSYLCGLCSIKTAQWAEAISQFDVYLNKYAKQFGYWDEAYFYRAFAEYRKGDYEKAYKDFEYFGSLSTPNISYTRRAYSYAAKSAVMTGDYEKAAVQAEKLTRISFTQADKQEAVVFCAEIYTDSGNYEKAIKILEPYTLGKSEFTMKALYQTAEIYEKAGDYEKTDALFEKIFTEFPNNSLAEEAMYRRGELYLSRRNYAAAETRFSLYLNNYANGTYADAAYYYSGDCFLQLKNYTRSVMQNKTLLSKFPKSPYIYAASKNLLEAYYAEEKYGEALAIAQSIETKFPNQAISDGINHKVIELEKIVGGTDRHIVEKQAEYDKNGGSSTKKGRNAGSELVKLLSVYASRKEAYELASELVPLQTGKDEFFPRAENCDFIAAYNKENGMAQSAAEMYLKAAEYYRSSGLDKTNKAAASLYAAVDAFISANMYGDAEQTANLLIKLYPSSRQALSVKSLLN